MCQSPAQQMNSPVCRAAEDVQNSIQQEWATEDPACHSTAHVEPALGVAGVSAAQSAGFYGRRLVFYNVAADQSETDLTQLFAAHGDVRSLYVVRNSMGQSCGCGNVTLATPEQASVALQALTGTLQAAEPGTTLGLLLVEEPPSASSTSCDSKSCASPSATATAGPGGAAAGCSGDGTNSTAKGSGSGASEGADSSGTKKLSRTVFFAKVPPTVTSPQLMQLFAACGEVAQMELFIPWPGAKISKGCGLVEYACSRAAAAAVHSLHHKFTWLHSHSALVVEWVDRSRQSAGSKAAKAAARADAAAAAAAAGHKGGLGSPGGAAGYAVHGRTAAGDWTMCRQLGTPGSGNARLGVPRGLQQQQQQQAHVQAMRQPTGNNTRSCPLPQPPPGWHVISTSQQMPSSGAGMGQGLLPQFASLPSNVRHLAAVGMPQQQQQQAGQVGSPPSGSYAATAGLQQQQQQQLGACAYARSNDGSSGPLWLVRSGQSSSASSAFDLSSLGPGSNFDSSANSCCSLLHGVGSGTRDQQQHLVAMNMGPCDGASAPGSSNMQLLEPSMAANAAAGLGSNTCDTIWQSLLQQNVMLLQTMNSPVDDDGLAVSAGQQGMMLQPTSNNSFVNHQQMQLQHQHQQLQASMGLPAVSLAAAGGASAAGGMPFLLSAVSQAQQQLSMPLALHGQQGGFLATAQQTQQQQAHQQQAAWLMLQQQQLQQQQQQLQQQQQQQQQMMMAGGAGVSAAEASVMLPLSQRQLAAMSSVLPQLPQLTGAKAFIGTAAGGGLQLVLAGSVAQLQAAYAAADMLLSSTGVDEPLPPGVIQTGGGAC